MKAFVLTAGAGARLRPLTDVVPKPMVPIGGRPLVDYTIEQLGRSGFSDVVLNLFHLPDVVTSHFGDGAKWNLRIHYSPEQVLLGTAGALQPWREFFDDDTLVIYGDNLSTCDFTELLRFHRATRAFATVAVFERDDVSQSGVVELDGDWIRRFIEKPPPGATTSHCVSAGILVLTREAVQSITAPPPLDFGRDVLPQWIAGGLRIAAYRMSGSERLWWIDTPADLARVERDFQLSFLQG